jgi:hypothetical protein
VESVVTSTSTSTRSTYVVVVEAVDVVAGAGTKMPITTSHYVVLW